MRMKRETRLSTAGKNIFTGLFLLSFLLMGALAGTTSAEESKNLRIATPFWEGQTNEDGTGLFFEIVKKVYEPDGIQVSYEFVPWKRAQKMVAQGDADAMLSVWKEHADKEGQIIPKYPMFVEYTAALFLKGKFPEWKGIESLSGKEVVWLRGYDYHTTPGIKDIKFNWSEVDDYDQAWGMIDRGRVDIYVDALIDLDNYIRDHKMDMEKKYRLEILRGENAYVAFTNTDRSKNLAQRFDERIMELYRSGELKKLYEKWNVRYFPAGWEK